jgi:hypothetical protein
VLHDQVVDVVLHQCRGACRCADDSGSKRSGLPVEACDALRIVRQMLGKRFDGDGAVQAGIDARYTSPMPPAAIWDFQLMRTEDTSDEPARNRRRLESATAVARRPSPAGLSMKSPLERDTRAAIRPPDAALHCFRGLRQERGALLARCVRAPRDTGVRSPAIVRASFTSFPIPAVARLSPAPNPA